MCSTPEARVQQHEQRVRPARRAIVALRSAALLAIGGVAACVVGCESMQKMSIPNMTLKPLPTVVKTPEPVAPSPEADEATRLRDWTPSVAYYHSGATHAWPTRWFYAPNPDYEQRINYLLDSLAFIGQSFALPVTLVLEPPFKQKVTYAGDVLPPTYTAMPPHEPAEPHTTSNPDPDPLVAPILPPAPPAPVNRMSRAEPTVIEGPSRSRETIEAPSIKVPATEAVPPPTSREASPDAQPTPLAPGGPGRTTPRAPQTRPTGESQVSAPAARDASASVSTGGEY